MSATCLHCGEPVMAGDAKTHTYISSEGPRPVHHECAARAVLGSVGHQMGRCSCHGGTEEDPPGMTKREAARAALLLFQRMQGGAAITPPSE